MYLNNFENEPCTKDVCEFINTYIKNNNFKAIFKFNNNPVSETLCKMNMRQCNDLSYQIIVQVEKINVPYDFDHLLIHSDSGEEFYEIAVTKRQLPDRYSNFIFYITLN